MQGECRICLEAGDGSNLVMPCECAGTCKYVHRECLEHWILERGSARCEVCKTVYKDEAITELGRRRLEEQRQRELEWPQHGVDIVAAEAMLLAPPSFAVPATRRFLCLALLSLLAVLFFLSTSQADDDIGPGYPYSRYEHSRHGGDITDEQASAYLVELGLRSSTSHQAISLLPPAPPTLAPALTEYVYDDPPPLRSAPSSSLYSLSTALGIDVDGASHRAGWWTSSQAPPSLLSHESNGPGSAMPPWSSVRLEPMKMGDGYSTVDDPTADHPAQPARAASGVDSLMGGGSGGNAGVHGGGQVHAAEPANALEYAYGGLGRGIATAAPTAAVRLDTREAEALMQMVGRSACAPRGADEENEADISQGERHRCAEQSAPLTLPATQPISIWRPTCRSCLQPRPNPSPNPSPSHLTSPRAQVRDRCGTAASRAVSRRGHA